MKPEQEEYIKRQLASVIHAARVAGPFESSLKSDEEGLQNAKKKLVTFLAAVNGVEGEVAHIMRTNYWIDEVVIRLPDGHCLSELDRVRVVKIEKSV